MDKKSNDKIDAGLLYQSIVNLQIDIAKLQQDVKWIKQIVYILLSMISFILVSVIIK